MMFTGLPLYDWPLVDIIVVIIAGAWLISRIVDRIMRED